MLAVIENILRAMRAALAGAVNIVQSILAGLLGGPQMPRPPAAKLQPPVSPENPIAESMRALDRNATKILRWASDCILRGRALVPALPPEVARWCDGLTRNELELLVVSGHRGVMAHLSGACPVAGVMPIGHVQRREVHEPEPDYAPAYAPR